MAVMDSSIGSRRNSYTILCTLGSDEGTHRASCSESDWVELTVCMFMQMKLRGALP